MVKALVPVVFLCAALAVPPARADAPTRSASSAPSLERAPPSFFRLFGIGAATTLVAAPASMALGVWVGTWSSNFYAGLIPAVLIVALLPPLVTVLVEQALGNHLWGAGTFKVGWSLVTGVLVQLALVAVTALVGLPGATVPGIALFTLMDVVLLGGATSGVMWVTRVEPMATVAARGEAERGGSAGSVDLPRAPAAAFATLRF